MSDASAMPPDPSGAAFDPGYEPQLPGLDFRIAAWVEALAVVRSADTWLAHVVATHPSKGEDLETLPGATFRTAWMLAGPSRATP